jgi:hypothetical protein
LRKAGWAGEGCEDFPDFCLGFSVDLFGLVRGFHVGVDEDPEALAEVVEHEDGVAQEKDGLGEVEGIGLGFSYGGFEKTDGVVGEKPDGASGEGGARGVFEAGNGDPAEGGHDFLELGEGIGGGLKLAGGSPLSDANRAAATFEDESRAGADEGVAAGFLAFFGGFEEVARAAHVEFLEGRDGGFSVGENLGPDGDEIAKGGEMAEVGEGRGERQGGHG